METGGDKVGIGFGGDFVFGTHRRIEILFIRVTNGYPSPAKSVEMMGAGIYPQPGIGPD